MTAARRNLLVINAKDYSKYIIVILSYIHGISLDISMHLFAGILGHSKYGDESVRDIQSSMGPNSCSLESLVRVRSHVSATQRIHMGITHPDL